MRAFRELAKRYAALDMTQVSALIAAGDWIEICANQTLGAMEQK